MVLDVESGVEAQLSILNVLLRQKFGSCDSCYSSELKVWSTNGSIVDIFCAEYPLGRMQPTGGLRALWLEQSIGKTKCVCCPTSPSDSRGRRGRERRVGVIQDGGEDRKSWRPLRAWRNTKAKRKKLPVMWFVPAFIGSASSRSNHHSYTSALVVERNNWMILFWYKIN